MITLKRLSVVMSVFGTGLAVAACASPTDSEIAGEPTQLEQDITASAESDGSEPDDVEDVASTSSELMDDEDAEAEKEESSVSQEQRYGTPGYGSPGFHGRPGRRHCDHSNAWHCRRGQPGWRWVRYRPGHHPGAQGRWGRYDRCCVHVPIRDHRGPHRW